MTTYYVDSNSGSDSNTGTSAGQAWASIGKVNSSSFSPNDNILFAQGLIHRTPEDGLMPPSSGSSGSPITFGSYDGGYGTDKPKIFGSADGTAMTWTQDGNIWRSEAVNYNFDMLKRVNRSYTDANPASGYENQGGDIHKGMELDNAWGNSWTKDTSSRYYTTLNNPYGYNWTHLIINGVLRGGPESSKSAVNAQYEWYYESSTNRLYLGTPVDDKPNAIYISIVVAELNSNGDWCYTHDGSNGYYFWYHSGGSPASQYSYLELPNCKLTVFVDNKDYVSFDDLEFRHGCEGVWVENGSSNCTITDCDVRQCCRNGLQIEGSNNTWTTSGGGRTSYIEKCGTEWFKRPFDSSEQRNGHCYHLVGGDNNLVENVILQDSDGEDGCQHANKSGIGTNNILRNVLIRNTREDGIDIKGGTLNLENSDVYAKGDGGGRNGILLHDKVKGVNVTDSYIAVESPAAADCLTREKTAPLTSTRTIWDALNGDAFCLDCNAGSGNVISKSSVYLGNTTRALVDVVNGYFDSRHDSFYPCFIKLGGSGANNILYNAAMQGSGRRLIEIENSGNLDADSCCLYRSDQTTGWAEDNGTVVSESDIDSDYNNSGVSFQDCKTVAPGFANPGNGDLSISSVDPAGSGGRAGTGVANDVNGNAFDTGDPEIGAYATGGITVEISDARHTLTTDNVTLAEIVTSVSLGVADALHAHGAENPSVSVEYNLGLGDAAHAHLADAISILPAPSINLRVADAIHGHTADNVDVSAVISVHKLDLADATHTLSSDSVGITVNVFVHELGLASALHAMTSDAASVVEFAATSRGLIGIPSERRIMTVQAENRLYKVS